MKWGKFTKAFRVGMAVLGTMGKLNINIKGVPTSAVIDAVNIAMTSGKTIKTTIQDAKNDEPQ